MSIEKISANVSSNSKKVQAFLVMTISVIVCMSAATEMRATDEIAKQALSIIGIGGLFVIGGQSLVDSIEKFMDRKMGRPATVPDADAMKPTTEVK